jgi:hypothetical protein
VVLESVETDLHGQFGVFQLPVEQAGCGDQVPNLDFRQEPHLHAGMVTNAWVVCTLCTPAAVLVRRGRLAATSPNGLVVATAAARPKRHPGGGEGGVRHRAGLPEPHDEKSDGCDRFVVGPQSHAEFRMCLSGDPGSVRCGGHCSVKGRKASDPSATTASTPLEPVWE